MHEDNMSLCTAGSSAQIRLFSGMQFSKEIFIHCLGSYNGRFASNLQLQQWRSIKCLKAVCRQWKAVLNFIGDLGTANVLHMIRLDWLCAGGFSSTTCTEHACFVRAHSQLTYRCNTQRTMMREKIHPVNCRLETALRFYNIQLVFMMFSVNRVDEYQKCFKACSSDETNNNDW